LKKRRFLQPRAFGGLVDSEISKKRCFFGMGFASIVPVDLATIMLASLGADSYTLLLIDEFYRMNNLCEDEIRAGLGKTREAIAALSDVFGFSPEIMLCSEFMHTVEYKAIFEETAAAVMENHLGQELLGTVPLRYRAVSGISYPLNELACTAFMAKNGIQIKIGPTKEKIYDSVMKKIGIGIDFSYLIDAFAVGTKIPEKVIHYVSENRGSGQRLYLDDTVHMASMKILMGPDKASSYFIRLASAAAAVLGNDIEDASMLYGKRLRKAARQMMMENLIRPFKEVAGYG
jgi:hypothetical protein